MSFNILVIPIEARKRDRRLGGWGGKGSVKRANVGGREKKLRFFLSCLGPTLLRQTSGRSIHSPGKRAGFLQHVVHALAAGEATTQRAEMAQVACYVSALSCSE